MCGDEVIFLVMHKGLHTSTTYISIIERGNTIVTCLFSAVIILEGLHLQIVIQHRLEASVMDMTPLPTITLYVRLPTNSPDPILVSFTRYCNVTGQQLSGCVSHSPLPVNFLRRRNL